jgi:hypothetical protein
VVDAAGHELVDCGDRIPVARIDDLGGAELAGELELPGTTSTATIFVAPAMRAPGRRSGRRRRTRRPQPCPPGDTWAVFSTAPTPVITAQPMSANSVSGRLGSTLTAVRAGTTDRSANDDVL